ncbi:MAG TPA: HepT-like ribonuclease domain-containing protein, partial [Longimicrobiales bacterium]|nr:HepT-like ribonuclease domain-containing protein [Longimicrobiales bacterium]
ASRLRALARDRSRQDFDADDVAQLAMLHLIQRLGEAASRLSADFRAANPEFPWGEMIGMRNRIVHAYDDLDPDIVWHIATEDIEAVIAALERVLAD